MSHLSNPFNEDVIYNEAEAKRLGTTVVIAAVMGAVLSLLFIVTAIFWLFSQEFMPAVVAVVSLVLAAASALIIARNKPRLTRLNTIKVRTGELVNQLAFHGSRLTVGQDLTFGTNDYGILKATKRSASGDSWELKAIEHIGMSGGGRLAFEGVLLLHRLDEVSAKQNALPYSNELMEFLDEMKHLVQASTTFSSSTHALAKKAALPTREEALAEAERQGWHEADEIITS